MFASLSHHPSLADVLQAAAVRRVFGEGREGILNSRTNPEVWKGLSSTLYNLPRQFLLERYSRLSSSSHFLIILRDPFCLYPNICSSPSRFLFPSTEPEPSKLFWVSAGGWHGAGRKEAGMKVAQREKLTLLGQVCCAAP